MFSVIIATCNRPERLARALGAVGSAVDALGAECPVIVVDNGDGMSAVDVVRGSKVPALYLRSEPLNKSVALNVGIAAATTVWLAFTDDDALPDANWLKAAKDFIGRTGIRAFGGRVVAQADGVCLPRWLRPGKSGRLPVGPALVEYAPLDHSGGVGDATLPLGCNMFVLRRLFDEYGEYNEDLWRVCGRSALGCEDSEFGFRIRSRGEKIGYCAEAIVRHPVYRERTSLMNHLRWAYRAGNREAVLCPPPDDSRFTRGFAMKLTLTSIWSCLKCSLAGDGAAAVCELMETAHAVGQVVGAGRL